MKTKTIKVDDIKDALPGDRIRARFVETGEWVVATAYHPDKHPEGWVSFLGWPLRKHNGAYGLGIKLFEAISITREVPELEYQSGAVYEITLGNGITKKAWCINTLDPNSWDQGERIAFVSSGGDEYEPSELTSIEPVVSRTLPTREQRAEVVDLLISFSNNRADEWDTADKILALVEQGGAAPEVTQEQIAKALFGTATSTASGATAGAAAVLALFKEGVEG